MIEDKHRWNERYKTLPPPQKPSDLLLRYIDCIKGKDVLDIAAGLGRHSRILAERGYSVDAIEYSDVALESLREISGVNAIEMDLENGCNLEKSYDAILCFNYLNRDLYNFMINHINNDGIILFETFVFDEENECAPKNPNYLLKKNELLKVFSSFHIIEYKESNVIKQNGQKALMASMAAIKK
ncbi:class I SAM-dependent methyltransferase [Hydrogenimonas thermophila]|uniref:class I SAM-dependent methyltransferase n=1 Tax=Hydrogenimonas thermophila TaxID=223786 RepID=UPI0029370B18|nr:class I SAM-dependent methyltransferase [Hydrogenimonas thermophila]WOE68751.1 class I SAM-dependent methyltransferase [Hydrogenimonas thermophila]WOE71261.1 class I SAM-dependent methyltransferase [Hydrogenimonas thermophila]